MKYPMSVFLALVVSFSLSGCSAPVQRIQREQPGDSRLSCGALQGEIAEMDRIIQESGIEAQKEGAYIQATEKSRQVGSDIAARKDHTAIPVVGDVASYMKRGMIQQQSDIRDQGYQARSRRSHLMILYNRKGCK